jgi:hypothetical protein
MTWIDFVHVSQAAVPYVAILISIAAIWVPARREQGREQNRARERHLEAQCLATALRFAVLELTQSLSHAQLIATSEARNESIHPISPADVLSLKTELPAILTGSAERVHLLGFPAGPTILKLIAVMEAFNQAMEARAAIVVTFGPGTPAFEHWKIIARFAAEALPTLQAARAQLDPIADHPEG